jgi:hypothetical protein
MTLPQEITFYIGMAEWLSLMGVFIGGLLWFDHKHSRSEQRIDRLYEMFIELIKEGKERK